MKARQWLQIAAVTSALGLTGTAIANDMNRTTHDDEPSAVVNSNPAAQLGTTLNGNSAAQLGADTPDAAAPPAEPDTAWNSDNNSPSNGRVTTPGDNVLLPRTGSDVQPGDKGRDKRTHGVNEAY